MATIRVVGVNDAPVVQSPLADQAGAEGAPLNFTLPALAFADAGDVLPYTSELDGGGPLPGWLSFDGGTRSLSGTPADGEDGVLAIRVTATDGQLASVSDVCLLAIAKVL